MDGYRNPLRNSEPQSQMDLRAFTFGIMVGIAMVIGCFAFVSYVAGLKWQPVKVSASFASEQRPEKQ